MKPGKKMQIPLMMFIFLISVIDPVMADEDMTSDLICPCECAMVISTCDCSTAIQVRKEIALMKEKGFSEKQIFSALQAEYGKEIISQPQKGISSLWIIGAALSLLLVFIGYFFFKRRKVDNIPDIKKYEMQFEEEYRNYVSEIDDPNKNIIHNPNDNMIRDDKL